MVYADFGLSSSARALATADVSRASGSWSPPLQRLFDTEAVPLHVWPWLFAGGFVFLVVVEMETLIIRSSSSPSLRDAVTAVESGT